MISYIIASIMAIVLGQITSHLIRRLPEIIEDDDAIKKLIPTLKTGFKPDWIYSLVLLTLFNLTVYFVGTTYLSYIYMVLISMLVVALVIDFKMQLIPDTVQVVILLLGIIVTTVDYTNWLGHIIGMLLGGLIFVLIAIFSKIVFRKEGMGMGDIKLMTGLGLIFGIKALPTSFMDFFSQAEVILTITVIAFFLAAIVAIVLIVTKKTEESQYMAFGPYIVIATILVIFLGTAPFLDVYFNACMWLANSVTDLMFKIIN
ncbi:MAG: prepilin peptidase [Clostridia bacterium]|nr:prepilin peptidase [Clostridia bacterium]